MTRRFIALLPGILLALALAALGWQVAHWLGQQVLHYEKSPISEITIAVVLGLLLRNLVGLPSAFEPGLKFCSREVLRIGIVLLGLKLSLNEVGQLGLSSLPVIVGCIVVALVTVAWINRALGLPRRLGSLIAVGTSICGVSAIAASGPVIDADEDEISYSVACITVFGLLALFAYPFLAHRLFADDPRQAGLFLGTSIHDTSQVTGAALTYQEQYDSPDALKAATVAKLTRNLFMIAVIPLIGMLYHRGVRSGGKWNLAQMIPLFVVGFVAAAGVRTIGDLHDPPFGILDKSTWKRILEVSLVISQWCLTTAMAAVGLGTNFQRIRKLGWKSFLVGFAAAAIVGVVSASSIVLLHR